MALDMQARHRAGMKKAQLSARKSQAPERALSSVSRDNSVDSNETDRMRESGVDLTAAQNNDPDRAVKFNAETSYVTVDTLLKNVPTLSASHFLPNVAAQLVQGFGVKPDSPSL